MSEADENMWGASVVSCSCCSGVWIALLLHLLTAACKKEVGCCVMTARRGLCLQLLLVQTNQKLLLDLSRTECHCQILPIAVWQLVTILLAAPGA